MKSSEQQPKWMKNAFGRSEDPQSLPLLGLWTEPNETIWPGTLVEGDDPAALPGVGFTLSAGLDRVAARARQLSQTWRQLASAVPLDPGLDLDLEETAAEQLLERDLPRLKQVCNRPRKHLRAEERREPVSLVRRITPRTIEQLAAKSQDWHARTFRGVRPARLLAQVTEDDWAIYENRATVTLQRHITRDLNQRTEHLLALLRQIEAIEQIDGKLSQGSRFRLDRASRLLGEAVQSPPSAEQLRELYEVVSKLSREVRGLGGSELLKQARLMVPVRPPLRLTNVFRDDEAYRRVAGLWWEWIERQSDRPATIEQLLALRRGRILAHRWLTQVLVLRAFKEMRLVNDKTPSWDGDNRQPLELGRGWQVQVKSGALICLEKGGRLVARILPLAMNWRRLPAEQASEWWALLTKLTDSTPTLCVGLDEEAAMQPVPGAEGAWPSQLYAAEMARIEAGRLMYATISPQRLDSIEGVLRFLRMVVYHEDWPMLPLTVPLQNLAVSKEARARAFEVNDGVLVLNRRPASAALSRLNAEAAEAATKARHANSDLAEVREEIKRLRRLQVNTGHLKAREPRLVEIAHAADSHCMVLVELSEKLAAADAAIAAAMRCPCCKSNQAAEIISVHFRCPSCSTEWGRDRTTGAPYIRPKGSPLFGPLWGADLINPS